MPPLIGAAIVAGIEAVGVTGLAGATVFGVSAATIIGYGVTTLALIGAQFAFNRMKAAHEKKTGDLQLTAVTIKQPIPVRTRAYGQVQLGGALFYEDAIPVIYQPLLLGIVHCEGPINRFLGIKLNDSISGVNGAAGADASGINASLPWAFYIDIESKRGTDTQAASFILNTQRGFTGQLKGLAYTVIMCTQMFRPDKYFQYYYPNGVPQIRVIAETSLVYDPRDGSQSWTDESTYKYSRNSAICIMDYLTRYKVDSSGRNIPRGMGLARSRINIASFIAFANICDQVYQSKYTINFADGSIVTSPRSEPRYCCDAIYSMDQAPVDVLNRMVATCDATLFTMADGTIGIRGGNYETPTVLINDDMILECEITRSTGQLNAFNRLKISFTAWNMDYQVIEGHPLDDNDSIADLGVLSQDLNVPYVSSYSQARRLARIAMMKGNPEWTYTKLTCTLAALNVLGEEFVHVTHSLPGIDGPFLVHNVTLRFDEGKVDLMLTSVDPAAYDWNPETDDATPPSPQGGTG